MQSEDDVELCLDASSPSARRSSACAASGEWQVGEIEAAIGEAEAGDFASDAALTALCANWQARPC